MPDYVVKHRAGWRYKRAVPVDLQAVVGTKAWTSYLQAKTRQQAVMVSAPMRARHDKVLAAARKLTADERATLVRLAPTGTLEERLAALEAIPDQVALASAFVGFAGGYSDPLSIPETDEDGHPTDYAATIDAIRAAKTSLVALEARKQSAATLIARTTGGSLERQPMGLVVDVWLRASGAQSLKGIERQKRTLRELIDVCRLEGSGAADVTSEHARTYRDHLDEKVTAGQISRSYAVDRMGGLRSMFEAAISHGLAAGPNPFAGVKPSAGPRVKFADTRRRREAFQDDHVRAIFAVCDKRVAQYQAMKPIWHRATRLARAMDLATAFRLLAYHGMRSGELIQMRCKDVVTIHDRLAFQITDQGEGQSLKTFQSLRTIPVHCDCVELVRDQLARASGALLFASFDGALNPGHTFQDAASEYIRNRAGIGEKHLTAHSLRHRWRCLARAIKMPGPVSRAILGHEIGRASLSDSDGSEATGQTGDHDLVYGRSRQDSTVLGHWIDRVDPMASGVDLRMPESE